MKRNGAIALVLFFFALLLMVVQNYFSSPPAKLPPNTQIIGPAGASRSSEFVFCHWNVENLFDDRYDARPDPTDREYDLLYASNPGLLQHKLVRLSEAILRMNGGRGPDILALVEVESVRAAELLQQTLNEKLFDPSLHYRNLLMQEIAVGRHVAPAILTRLPVMRERTRTLDKQQRILVGHILVNEQELVVIASHWTSRLQGDARERAEYADKIYGLCSALHRGNPAADFLVSGDFDTDPADESVTQRLHAIGDVHAVRAGNPLRLFNLCAGKDPSRFGTRFDQQWRLFDQIAVAPGLLDDRGWTCDVNSTEVFHGLHKPGDPARRPWHFGSEYENGERGYSDHFPVLVKLRLEKTAPMAELSERR